MTSPASNPALRLTPFKKILIANRGEIAVRIERAAKRLGYATAAVYSTADAQARHARQADEAIWIGESPPAQSYLRIDAILEAAKTLGADAIHPGYGFLAENAAFARACRDAGLVFVGPSPESIEMMGDKAGAKMAMAAAGLPCTPGFQGEQDEHILAREAEKIGFPLMIKACAGGGGRGMRRVADPQSFLELLRSAKSEARGAFGDDSVLLERALIEPRHIEIQIFVDRYGHAIHLGERDCSVQRRHQKLIEESPSLAVSDALRARMGEAAAAAAKAIGYEGAGTLEFLLDQDGGFYFMEMNTRLQVEHPVTEAVTGLDLVALQLRIASGEPLGLTQGDIKFSGWAMEARLCAEDPAHDFLPQSGQMAAWRPAENIRIDSGLGDDPAERHISPFYDSMIAKVIAHGRSREEARRKLIHGLRNTLALGAPTNQSFLIACLENPDFAASGATTGFIETHRAQLFDATDRNALPDEGLAALLLFLTRRGGEWRPGRALTASYPAPLRFTMGGKSGGEIVSAEVWRERAGDYAIIMQEKTFRAQVRRFGEGRILFEIDNESVGAFFVREGARLSFMRHGLAHMCRDLTYDPPQQERQESDGALRASMNGKIVAVMAKLDDVVERGQPLVTLEAMKMEHVHKAPISGRICEICAIEGAQAATDMILVKILAPDQEIHDAAAKH